MSRTNNINMCKYEVGQLLIARSSKHHSPLLLEKIEYYNEPGDVFGDYQVKLRDKDGKAYWIGSRVFEEFYTLPNSPKIWKALNG